MRVLIAGLGSIGRRHLRNLLTLDQGEIILFRTHQSTLPEDELAEFPVETDLNICTGKKARCCGDCQSHSTAYGIAIPAAQAGCHLLIEKPVATKWDEKVDEFRHIVSNKAIRTLVAFQFRFHPVLARIKDLLEGDTIGRMLSFRVHWGEYLPGWHPWEDYRLGYAARKDLGGGVVNTLCHPLDYVRWLFGEVESLSAMTGHVSELDLDVEDVAEISLRMTNGGVGSIHLDYFQRPPAHWIKIICEKGAVHWDNDTGNAKVYHVDGDEWEVIAPPEGFERNALFLDEMRHFLSLVKGEADSRCSLEDGIAALKLTKSVHQSARTGCVVGL